MEVEPKPQFTVTEMRVDEVEAATAMRLQSWRDTYVNEEVGVSAQWIDERNRKSLTAEKAKERRERFIKHKQAGTFNAWVAKDDSGEIIGSTTPFRDEDGKWRLGSLYVDKRYYGAGVGQQLMQQAMDWIGDDHDVHLGVVVYNERAKAFYRKWGFVEISGSEELFDGVMPEVKMVRKAPESMKSTEVSDE